MTAFAGAGLPWPVEPYPGLRPFLEREASLLFGRKRQIAEVIDRLRQTQFVAVLGGSGSGKSSLIHAGVIPELRSYGIHAAGDLWLPTVCTPGTNVSAEDRLAGRHTPVVRLARRFAELLTSRGSEQADAERVESIAAVFRQDGGFARLLDVFGHELALEPGLRQEDARVLFVLDQFEEVFHPTNADVKDAHVLVERTLDHFFAPHPRCFVVLTMRSEHLNDCAGYLELPDAINKSSYMVRRLDQDELREAIVGPTEHFLRLMQLKRQRDEDSGVDVQALPPLPAQVQFEPIVIERLLEDVGDITHDPDHLPLLQHLLARLWQVARARAALQLSDEHGAEVIPACITAADLHCAVAAERVPTKPLSADNTLRASVDAWPSAAMRKFSEQERSAIDEVLRRLGFKDPKTGMYSQQRLRVHSEAPRILGAGKTADDLYQLLHDRFLTSVNYLFWDQHDPDNVTLKVSHEALIRGWAHFQQLVDTEFEYYEGFVATLRRCADWLESNQSPYALLGRIDLERQRDSRLGERLARPELRGMWLRSLGRERDAARLVSVEPALDDYLARSFEQERMLQQRTLEQEQLSRQHRRRVRGAWVALAAVMVLLPWGTILLYAKVVQDQVTVRLDGLFQANRLSNTAELAQAQEPPALGSAHRTLSNLLTAAEKLRLAREAPPRWVDWVPGVGGQREFVREVADGIEPAVNGRLRQLLSSAVFAVKKPDGQALPAPLALLDAKCRSERGGFELSGELLVHQANWSTVQRRALFRPVAEDGQVDLVLLAASALPDGSDCEYGGQVARIPGRLHPHALVDSDLRFLVYGVDAYDKGSWPANDAAVTVLELAWERDRDDDRHRLKPTTTRSVITQVSGSQKPTAKRPDFVQQVVDAAGGEGRLLAAVPTWRAAGGRTLQIGSEYWRMVAPGAQHLRLAQAPSAAQPASGGLVTVAPRALKADDAACQAIAKSQYWPDGTDALSSGSLCVLVSYPGEEPPPEAALVPPGAASALQPAVQSAVQSESPADATNGGNRPQATDATRLPRQDAFVAVIARQAHRSAASQSAVAPAPIASFSPFGRVRRDSAVGTWFLLEEGPCAGWLLGRVGRDGDDERYLAAPWSTAALQALGQQIERAGQVAQPGQPAQPAPAGCVTPP